MKILRRAGMRKRRHAFLISLTAAALATLPWGLLQPRLLDDLRNFVFDSYQRAAPRPFDPQTPARVVGVDEASLKAYGQWPWPRTRLAELVTRLNALGAAAIAFDFLFAEPDRSSLENIAQTLPDPRAKKELLRVVSGARTNDQLFADALAKTPSVLGATLSAQGGKTVPEKAGFAFAGDEPTPFLPAFPAIVAPLPVLAEAARGLGATNWLPDHDQIVRRVPLVLARGQTLVPSLALEALRVAQGESTFVLRASNASGESAFGLKTGVNAVKVGAFEIATGAAGEVRPRYSYTHPARDLSAAAVLASRVDRAEIEGRIVFVGALATAIGDIRATPLEAVVPGVEIHAQIIESLTSGALLSRPDWAPGLEFFVALAAFCAVMALLFLAPPVAVAAFGLAAVSGLFAGSFYLFDTQGLLLDPAYPSLTIIGGYIFGAFTLWRLEQAAKHQIREAFGKFVAPAVVDRLAEHPERLALGGETRELTVLFADMRGFSSISEGMSARELTHFMNDYFTPMTDIILDRDGTIDKYVGDAILAFWNAPLDVPDHPRKAVTAALEMRGALALFNETRALAAQAAGRDHRPVGVGVGLHLGPCNVGNMGSIRRFDYSVLGDTVNLASRLDGACKMFKTDIVVSAAVQGAAPEFAWLDLGRVAVLGRAAPERIFALAGGAEVAAAPAFQSWRAAHEAMRAHYEARRFFEAAEAARSLADTVAAPWRPLYMALQTRFAALASQGAGEEWSSVWSFDSK